jgi:AraC-like DNA-binding protein
MQKSIPSINWNSSDILAEIAHNIQNPLASIIEVNNSFTTRIDNNTNPSSHSYEDVAAITLVNSRKIASLIEEVLEIAKLSSVNISNKGEPVIFDIYDSTPNVRAMCQEEIVPARISIADKEWLKNLEDIVFKEIAHSRINLFQLSYQVAVSERQLHRNIRNLLFLTPNNYIRILKLHKAKCLLEKLVYRSISEVAYAVGFLDIYYFTKAYYKQYGIMPKEYFGR